MSGFITKEPAILPILTAPTGPLKGISEMVKAADMLMIPRISAIFSSP